jgi:protoporphyrinogen oxidase
MSAQTVIIGGGFTGLSAAYELALRGGRPCLLEASPEFGGLASDEAVGGTRLERFYHHWFTSDSDALDLVRELGLESRLVAKPSKTGMYLGNRFWKLSSPLDLLFFSPLPLLDRLRLGWMTLRVRQIQTIRT